MEDIVPDLDPTPGEDKRQDMERIGEMTDRSPQTHGEWEKEKNRRVTEGRMTIHQTEAEKKQDRAGNQPLLQGAAQRYSTQGGSNQNMTSSMMGEAVTKPLMTSGRPTRSATTHQEGEGSA